MITKLRHTDTLLKKHIEKNQNEKKKKHRRNHRTANRKYNSIRYSQATRLSSLLCPCSRGRNKYGISVNRYGTGVDAKRSTRILKPWPERRLAARSKAGREIKKNPLIGSLSSAGTTIRARRPAIPLIVTRRRSHSPTPPPAA